MKDPTRLLDATGPLDDAGELQLRLLRAGASEQPPTAAMLRLAERLDVGAPPPTAAGTFGLLKLGGALFGIALAGVVWVSVRSSAPPAAHPAPKQETVAPAAPIAAPSEPAQAAPTPAASSPSLALEIARIDAIRQLLARNQARPAIAALRDYKRDFPTGVLQQEAEVLSIEAQKHAGDKRGARALATRFLANNPDSPHSPHVRELLDALGADAR